MLSNVGKSTQLDEGKREELLDLFSQGEAANPSAWQLFWLKQSGLGSHHRSDPHLPVGRLYDWREMG